MSDEKRRPRFENAPVFKTELSKLGEPNDFDLRYWQEAGPQAIWDAADEMVQTYYMIMGIKADDVVFQRTVTNLKRI